MAEDWEFDLPLSDPDREIVLRRWRAVRRAILAGTSVSAVVDDLVAQVEGRVDHIRLRLRDVDEYGLFHFSACLGELSRLDRVDCLTCGGSGKVDVPRQARNLVDQFDYRYSLAQVGPPEREKWLSQPCDKAERDRLAAERAAELERQKADLRRRERESYGLLPGTVVEARPAAPSPPSADFMPASAGHQLEDAT